jgi:hypothetical protein
VPRWTELPLEVRRKTESKLAQLIRLYAARLGSGKEFHDERED